MYIALIVSPSANPRTTIEQPVIEIATRDPARERIGQHVTRTRLQMSDFE
ncbi:hypothetical protein DB30_00744 [Enhygromyxa salina]|uniref:Uncharacterized protein n=1 Tax=Enhygromyxa salina TaxID=215803 RepID=A0A0C1ZLQ4_9BACT|nr:hypothetical protein DB30_00744 [Enhygromyxa salina]